MILEVFVPQKRILRKMKMANLTVIYTLDAEGFLPGNFPSLVDRRLNNPILAKLRVNYQRLREQYPQLPLEVGVITFAGISKRLLKEWKDEIGKSRLVSAVSSYTPLDLLDEVLKLEQKGYQSEFAYRISAFLFSNPALTLDKSLTLDQHKTIMFGSCIPGTDKTIEEMARLIEEINSSKCEFSEEQVRILRGVPERIRSIVPTWEDVRALRDSVAERFRLNQVSRDFPLYFCPPKNLGTMGYKVGLKDEIQTPEYIPKIIEILEVGAKAQGLDRVPPEILAQVMVGQTDLFGKTETGCSTERLVESLPNPKTIITDLYFADQFPKIAKEGFDSLEFRL